MTPTDIERLAREAGMWQDGDRWFTPGKSALDVSTAQLPPEWDQCGYEIARAIEAAHGIKSGVPKTGN